MITSRKEANEVFSVGFTNYQIVKIRTLESKSDW